MIRYELTRLDKIDRDRGCQLGDIIFGIKEKYGFVEDIHGIMYNINQLKECM